MSEFVEHVLEVLEPYGTIRARRMFGGYGIYRDDVIFGLVVDEVLYLKTDGESVAVRIVIGSLSTAQSKNDA